MNINHIQAHLFKQALTRLRLISFSAFLSSLFSNYDQMSAAMAELLNHHKSSHQSLMNGPACTHTVRQKWVDGIKTRNCILTFMWTKKRTHVHTRSTPNRFLPSYARLPNPAPDTLLLSSHLVWTINFQSFTLLGGGKQFQNFIQANRKERQRRQREREREREWEEEMRALLAFSFWRTLRLAEQKKYLSQFQFTGGPINPHTPAHTYTHTQRLR